MAKFNAKSILWAIWNSAPAQTVVAHIVTRLAAPLEDKVASQWHVVDLAMSPKATLWTKNGEAIASDGPPRFELDQAHRIDIVAETGVMQFVRKVRGEDREEIYLELEVQNAAVCRGAKNGFKAILARLEDDRNDPV